MGTKKEMDDRFKKFGTVSYTAVTKVNDFIDRLEKGEVSGTRCKSCGEVFFPPRADCCRCLSAHMEWFPVEGSGKLLAYSKLKYAPTGFEGDLPYYIGVLDYRQYKVFGRIAGNVPEEEIRIGLEMKTVPRQLPDGRWNYVFTKA